MTDPADLARALRARAIGNMSIGSYYRGAGEPEFADLLRENTLLLNQAAAALEGPPADRA